MFLFIEQLQVGKYLSGDLYNENFPYTKQLFKTQKLLLGTFDHFFQVYLSWTSNVLLIQVS